jgi:hypothetical protein
MNGKAMIERRRAFRHNAGASFILQRLSFGALRRNGNEAWSKWELEDVLEYFWAATNIEMSPKPRHPEHFELRRSP